MGKRERKEKGVRLLFYFQEITYICLYWSIQTYVVGHLVVILSSVTFYICIFLRNKNKLYVLVLNKWNK